MLFFFLFKVSLQKRYAECPLEADTGCKMKLKGGISIGHDSHISLPLNTHCHLHFEDCPVGDCFTIFDYTFKRMYGNPWGSKLSLFSNFSIEYGKLFWRGSYVAFRIYSRQFDIDFTTKTPEEYYAIHPEDKLNQSRLFEISQFHTGMSACNEL